MASILSRGRSVKDRNCWHTEIRGVQRFKMADMTKSQYIPINDDKIVFDTFQKSQRSVLIWWVGSHCWVTIPVNLSCSLCNPFHNDVIKWKPFLRYWPFVWGIHRSPVNSPHKGQWRRALMLSFIYALNKGLSKLSWDDIALIMTSL